ncbi:MAG: hypothetical protein ABMA00_17965, partial [Gemmatimonas sp.]
GGGGGGGGFGGRGGGGGTQGPHVLPGTYSVALVADGKVVDTKPLTIVMDPQVQMTTLARAQYNTLLMDLHGIQKRGADVTAQLTALYTEMQKMVPKVDSSSATPAVKAQFAAFRKEFDVLRPKFGIGIPAVTFAPGGGGGGRGGAAGPEASANVMARVGTVKGAIMGAWETPSASLLKQVTEVKAALPPAIAAANAFMVKARAMSTTLAPFGLTLTVAK